MLNKKGGTCRTSKVGDIGLLKAMLDIAEKGWHVSVPLSEHLPFDLVITKGRVSKTVQVKARTSYNGKVQVHFTDSHRTRLVKDEVDWYCIYCIDNDTCYYIDPSHFGGSVALRIEEAKNGQKKDVK